MILLRRKVELIDIRVFRLVIKIDEAIYKDSRRSRPHRRFVVSFPFPVNRDLIKTSNSKQSTLSFVWINSIVIQIPHLQTFEFRRTFWDCLRYAMF